MNQETSRARAAYAIADFPEVQPPAPPAVPQLRFIKLTVNGKDYIALPAEQGTRLRDFLLNDQAYHEKFSLRFNLLKEQNEQLKRLYR